MWQFSFWVGSGRLVAMCRYWPALCRPRYCPDGRGMKIRTFTKMMMSAFLQLLFLFIFFLLCFGSCVSPCRRRRRRHSVSSLGPSRRALARSLLSTVTGDDKMMESMSNAVAILLVTGGAFREPSCRALLRSTFPRHSSTPARLYSTLLSLYFFLFQRSRSTPYITQPSNTTTTLFSLYTLFFFFFPIFIPFFFFI